MDEQTKSIRDFVIMYNKISEHCFRRCVTSFNDRELSADEVTCVERCAAKEILLNNRFIKVFLSVRETMKPM
ncbi:mitochondrial import inner membrane translocase subunit Tim10B-like [Schistocerca nitens]|uniref:mitochondrial import inner membrane translocase subunit Tim10B-like n=1 Tax=Schistocerca nitens TaxID=7011 RepID=UPI002118D6D4|nr:mitochondrial import inner membrane translocase subunit Tim10B-like [Schistocerca nitens]